MITNKICENCQSFDVCKIADIIYKFDKDAKKQLGVDIEILSCVNISPVDEEDVSTINDRDD